MYRYSKVQDESYLLLVNTNIIYCESKYDLYGVKFLIKEFGVTSDK